MKISEDQPVGQCPAVSAAFARLQAWNQYREEGTLYNPFNTGTDAHNAFHDEKRQILKSMYQSAVMGV